MNFNNSPYDAVGVSIVEELFKQAEIIAPIDDESTPKKPSLLRRVIHGLRDHQALENSDIRSHAEDCASPEAI
ncbi:MAG: hypothetical protein GC179_11820 [Anaerolineaceae bacterium]|nr:hypothetical protein [Anaerolineaceae bacterium]